MPSLNRVTATLKPKIIPEDADTLTQNSPEGCLQREARLTAALESLAHPLIVSDRDAAVNVGFCKVDARSGNLLVRLRQPSDQADDYGWEDCRMFSPAKKDTWSSRRLRLIESQDKAQSRARQRDRLTSVELRATFPSRHASSQFEAISWALYRTRSFAETLRKQSIETMAAHPDMYSRLLGTDFPTYLAHMSLPTSAGDELTLKAMGHRYGIHICVATGERSQWLLRFPPPVSLSRRQVVLAWCNGAWAPVRCQTVFDDFKQAMLRTMREQPIRLF